MLVSCVSLSLKKGFLQNGHLLFIPRRCAARVQPLHTLFMQLTHALHFERCPTANSMRRKHNGQTSPSGLSWPLVINRSTFCAAVSYPAEPDDCWAVNQEDIVKNIVSSGSDDLVVLPAIRLERLSAQVSGEIDGDADPPPPFLTTAHRPSSQPASQATSRELPGGCRAAAARLPGSAPRGGARDELNVEFGIVPATCTAPGRYVELQATIQEQPAE